MFYVKASIFSSQLYTTVTTIYVRNIKHWESMLQGRGKSVLGLLEGVHVARGKAGITNPAGRTLGKHCEYTHEGKKEIKEKKKKRKKKIEKIEKKN